MAVLTDVAEPQLAAQRSRPAANEVAHPAPLLAHFWVRSSPRRRGTWLALFAREVVMSRFDKEAAVRHQPVAWGSDLRSSRLRSARTPEPRTSSETRLSAVVLVTKDKPEDERDPYADVPCTD
jgi:hypothetical protein